MSAAGVLAILARLDASGVAAVVDGGWGVDALLGEQTRPHADLDLVVEADRADVVIRLLRSEGWAVLRDLRPTAIALGSPEGAEVDLHLVVRTADGGAEQRLDGDAALAGSPPFRYPPPVLGRIAGSAVACVDAATQIGAHRGYPVRPVDRADVALLAARFGLPVPSELTGRD